MLDASSAQDDYAARVAADVAARYGVAVNPQVVQRVPAGMSSAPQVIWDGKQLVYEHLTGSGNAWRGRSIVVPERRKGLADPVVHARRKQVAEAHGRGLSDMAIAAELQIDIRHVRADRKVMRLKAHVVAQRGPSTQTEIRVRLVRQMCAEGKSRAEMCAFLGINADALRNLARSGYVTLPDRVAGQRPASLARVSRLREMVEAGASRAEILAEMGVSLDTLRHLARQAGVALPLPPEVAARRERLAARAVARSAQRRPTAADLRAEREALIRGLDVANMTVAEIGEAIGGKITLRRLRIDLRRMGLEPMRTDTFGTVDRREARLAKLRAMDVASMTADEIAACVGVSATLVNRDLRALGLEARKLPKGLSGAQVSVIEARRARIKDMAASGMTRKQIMAAEGIGDVALWSHLRALGIVLRRADCGRVVEKGSQSKELMDALRDKVGALRRQGLTIKQIAKAVGRSNATVSHHLKVLGLSGGA